MNEYILRIMRVAKDSCGETCVARIPIKHDNLKKIAELINSYIKSPNPPEEKK